MVVSFIPHLRHIPRLHPHSLPTYHHHYPHHYHHHFHHHHYHDCLFLVDLAQALALVLLRLAFVPVAHIDSMAHLMTKKNENGNIEERVNIYKNFNIYSRVNIYVRINIYVRVTT